jgi:transcriptional regulator with XRE-family HTH domain
VTQNTDMHDEHYDDDGAVRRICGQRLQVALQARGWRAPQLADAIGMHRSAVNAWIEGSRTLSVTRLVQIARVLQVPPAALLPLDEESPLAGLCALLLAVPPDIHAKVLAVTTQILQLYQEHRGPPCAEQEEESST